MKDVLRLVVEAVDDLCGPGLPVILALLDASPLGQQERVKLPSISDINCANAHSEGHIL